MRPPVDVGRNIHEPNLNLAGVDASPSSGSREVTVVLRTHLASSPSGKARSTCSHCSTSYDDLAFTPPQLGRISARTLLVQGDRDPLYPVELGVELFRSIPAAALSVVPNAGHGPVFGCPRCTVPRGSTWVPCEFRI